MADKASQDLRNMTLRQLAEGYAEAHFRHETSTTIEQATEAHAARTALGKELRRRENAMIAAALGFAASREYRQNAAENTRT
jgi:hypothetical protein